MAIVAHLAGRKKASLTRLTRNQSFAGVFLARNGMVALARTGIREIIMTKFAFAAGAVLLAAVLASFGPSQWAHYPSAASLAAVSPHDMTVSAPHMPVAPIPDAF